MQKGVVEEIGCVVEARPGRAVVRLAPSEACASCRACTFMDAREGGRGMLAEADDPLGARPGDTVRVRTTGAEGTIKAALLLFAMPLALLLAGAALAHRLLRDLGLGVTAAQGLSVLFGLALMAAAYATLYLLRRRGKNSMQSRVVEILARSADAP